MAAVGLVIAVFVVIRTQGGGVEGPLPLWALATLEFGLLVMANALSHYWDRVRGHGRDRQLLESVVDGVIVVVTATVAAPLFPRATIVAVLTVLGLVVGLRLSRGAAVAIVVGSWAAIVAWSSPALLGGDTFPSFEGLVLGGVASISIVVVVTWTVRILDDMRRSTLDAASSLDHANLTIQQQASDLRTAVRRERVANNALQRTTQDLDRFVAMVAHDVRSPLATAQMLAAQATDPGVPDAVRARLLSRVVPQLERSIDLIERLYQNARAGRIELSWSDVALGDVVADVLGDHAAVLAEAAVQVDLVPALPPVAGDATLLRQLLGNLVGNAVRHGRPSNGRPARLSIVGRQDGDRVVVEVRDNGPGIHDGGDLFQPGRYGNGDRSGLGLGLSTSRTIVERHGGSIRARRGDPVGTVVEFYLPARGAASPVDDGF